jgi:FdhE protein
MENITYEPEAMQHSMDRIIERNPHVENLLNAFRPILLEKDRLLQLMQDHKKTFTPDTIKFQGGITLIQQFQLIFSDDPWKLIALSVSRAIPQGFPALQEEMRLLEGQIETGELNCYDFFQDSSTKDDDLQLMTWAVKCSVSTAALGLFLRTVESVILSKRAADMKDILAPLTWNRGYCPVCASMPMLAVTREQGQQWLQCSRCSHEWKFARLTCPACEHAAPEDTTYLYVDGKPEEQAFVCENCQKYLITTNQAGSLQAPCPEILAISLAHLDLILQDRGYSQMAICDWNTL